MQVDSEGDRRQQSKSSDAADGNDLSSTKQKPIYRKYGRKKVLTLQVTYIVAAILWICLVIFFEFHHTDIYGLLILSIPLWVYLLSFINANKLTVEVEQSSFVVNYLSIGIIVIVPLLTLSHNKDINNCNKDRLIQIIIVALVLAVLSVLDVWVQPKYVSIAKHIKSILQAASLTLIVYSLYVFYRGSPRKLK